MKLRSILLMLALTALVPAAAFASSHSEAPGTAKDRLADDTDLYAWVSPDAMDKVTIVANWVPLLEPATGPNFYAFDDDAHYYVNVDNVGDATAHIRYEFEFKTTRRTGDTFLYNTGVVNALNSPSLNVVQTYTITRWDNGSATVLAHDLQVAPAYVGPVSMPNYMALATAAVYTLSDGSKVFVGPRDDPFFVDLGATFDLLTIRKPPGNRGGGQDALAGFDVMTVALQIPKTRLTSDGLAPTAQTGVIGLYSTTERPAQRTLNGDGTISNSGSPVQVSRLGNPLVNEVVIPLKDKNRFNATLPAGDGAFVSYVTDPELAHLLTALYGIATPPAPRNDLVTVFLTGIPGLNKPANPNQVACEMLRLNMTIAPSATPSRFGLLGGDTSGFPNGRRLFDDVVDIAERVVAGATPFTPAFNVAPNNSLGDGVDANDKPFLPYFPYVAPPQNPLDHKHHRESEGDDDRDDKRRDRKGGRDDAQQAADPTTQSGATDIAARSLSVRNAAGISRMEFSVATASHVTLRVYDVAGRNVRTLLDQDAAPGAFVANWDGRDESGVRLSRGLYFVRLVAGTQVSQKKVTLQ